ncbi:putative non-specific serine/threonine protein kinase [Helianthus annuus]|nr:putative non-specific serine/threonine protein kinase [Helianthus annuus]
MARSSTLGPASECLEELSLTDCTSLRDIPNSICKMTRLKCLALSGCHQVQRLPEEIGCLQCLEELDLTGYKSLQDIPNSIGKMKSLKRLDLSDCHQVRKLPEELGCLPCLEELDLTGCRSLLDIPNSICKIKCLQNLDLSGCIRVGKLPEELGSLECLEELSIEGTAISCLPQSIYQMKDLRIYGLSGNLESNDCFFPTASSERSLLSIRSMAIIGDL